MRRMGRPAGLVRRWAAPAACVVAALALFSGGAHAQRTSSLSWVRLAGAEQCISTQELAERVEQRLGRRVFVSASQADLSLEGHVERVARPESFVATLVVSDRSGRVLGQRVLRAHGASCQALEDSLVLVIAIAIDPGRSLPAVLGPENQLSEQAEGLLAQLELPKLSEQQLLDELAVPDPVPEPSAPPPPARSPPASDRPPAAATAVEPARGTRLRLHAAIGAELGVLPEPGLGGVLGLTILPQGFLPIDVWLTALLPQRREAADEAGAGKLTFAAVGAGLCPLFVGVELVFRACAGARAGVLQVAGTGFAESFDYTGAWLEATLYTGLWLPLGGGWTLHAGLGAGAPVVRDTFRSEDTLGRPRVLHRASAVSARLELGAGVSF